LRRNFCAWSRHQPIFQPAFAGGEVHINSGTLWVDAAVPSRRPSTRRYIEMNPRQSCRNTLSYLAARYRYALSLTTLLLLRVDIVPPGLALGQGVYESGYGSSRFALTGNALFGQWTWGGNSMKPLQHC